MSRLEGQQMREISVETPKADNFLSWSCWWPVGSCQIGTVTWSCLRCGGHK